MKKFWFTLFSLCLSHAGFAADRPQLIVLMIGDQVRADYLERFHSDLVEGGLRRFRDHGIYYRQAFRDDAVEKTSPGHVLFGSGLYARDSGIVNNDWFDVIEQRSVSAAELVPGQARVSLRWFTGRSLAQRVHAAFPTAQYVSVSFKDRGSLLLGGPDQNEAYWFDSSARHWVSYAASPEWLANMPPADPLRTADAVTEQVAERILLEDHLGAHETPDVLTVSFSQVDLVGHQVGPDAPEMRDAVLGLDLAVARLMDVVDKTVGKKVVWVFSADHGVTPLPEVSRAQGLDAGRVAFDRLALPHPEWIKATATPFIYLDPHALPTENARWQASTVLQQDLLQRPGIAAVYLSGAIEKHDAPLEIQRSYVKGRTGDLWVVLKPHYIFADAPHGTTHGQPTPDDQHVPLGFYGMNVPAVLVDQKISPVCVAPTVLQLLQSRGQSKGLSPVCLEFQ